MTSWQMPRLDRSKNSEWPWNVNVVQHEKVLNISDILYYREINTWWFLSEFIKLLRWNIVWLQSVSMKCLCKHRSMFKSQREIMISKLCFCEHREYVWQNEKIYSEASLIYTIVNKRQRTVFQSQQRITIMKHTCKHTCFSNLVIM